LLRAQYGRAELWQIVGNDDFRGKMHDGVRQSLLPRKEHATAGDGG